MQWVRHFRSHGETSTLLRRAWGLGISSVMIIAVSPYPVMGLVSSGEAPHRIHNTVGALQYLPLWAVPVLMFTLGHDRMAAWRMALASSVAIAATGIWSGDLIPALSWMPMVTLLVLWPKRQGWKPERLSPVAALATVLVGWVAVTTAPHLVDLQRLHMGDSHSLRYHFSGMAAAYIALSVCCGVVALFPVGRPLRSVVALSVMLAGLCSLAWSNYESALSASSAVVLVVSGTVLFMVPTGGQKSSE